MKKFYALALIFAGASLVCPQNVSAIIEDKPQEALSVVFEEDFSLFKALSTTSYTPIFTSNETNNLHPEFFHQPEGWKGYYVATGLQDGFLHFVDSDQSYIQTPILNLTADGGKVTISFEAKKSPNGAYLMYVQLRDRTNGADKTITGILSNNVELTDNWKVYTMVLQGGNADCSVRFMTEYPAELRNVKIMQNLPQYEVPVADTFTNFTGNGFTANWRPVENATSYLLNVFTLDGTSREYFLENHELTATTYDVAGLDPSKVYHYSVKAKYANGTSDESNIIRCFGVPQPVLDEMVDVTKDGFTLTWDAPYNANIYQVETYIKHTATTDEKYCLLQEDFLNTPHQDVTYEEPVSYTGQTMYLDDYISRSNYIVSNPAFANDCLSLNNVLASIGSYGIIYGPTMDLSNGGGQVEISMRVRGLNAASMTLYMFNYVEKPNEWYSDKIVDKIENTSISLNEQWQTLTFTLKGGNEQSYIAIEAYGYGAFVQIDYLEISQNLKAGETVRVPFRSVLTDETEAHISTVGENFNASDVIECELLAVYKDDEETVSSPWSEVLAIAAPSGVENVGVASQSVKVTTLGNSIHVVNPSETNCAIFSLNGTLIETSNAPEFTTKALSSGVYVVSTPEGAVKVIL